MKIQSNFKDYYDSCLGLGRDESILYKRHTNPQLSVKRHFKDKADYNINKVVLAGNPDIEIDIGEDAYGWYDIINYLPSVGAYKYCPQIKPFVILFCGKAYEGLEVELINSPSSELSNPNTKSRGYFYDLPSLQNFVEKNRVANKVPLHDKPPKSYKFSGLLGKNSPRKPDVFYDGINNITEKYKEDLILNKIICASITVTQEAYGEQIYIYTLEPRLANFDFIKVMPPHQAYQELSMYIGGIISPEDKEMVTIDDKYKVLEHGFDPKFGFRKRPKKN